MGMLPNQDVTERHLRPILRELLLQCTLKQITFFSRMYKGGVDEIDVDKIPRAIQQVEATIKKNEG